MAVKKVKPTSPGRRAQSYSTFEEITSTTPERSLLKVLKKKGGRNVHGRITCRHRGGGNKRHYRIVEFKRDKTGLPAKGAAIEYDPNRSARIALLNYVDGEKRYILAQVNLRVGDTVLSGPDADIKPGNTLPLTNITLGTHIHNIDLRIGKGGQIVRGAGTSATLTAIEGKWATIKLPSSEVRMVLKEAMATIGSVSNPDWRLIRWGKAGRMRHRGIRPTVRGKVMNPVDHPHGGGEARNPIGLKHPKTPTGKPALGVKTRKKKRTSNKFIVKRRKAGKHR